MTKSTFENKFQDRKYEPNIFLVNTNNADFDELKNDLKGIRIVMINKMALSVLNQDRASIVMCDLEHTIVYMNPSAISRYAKRGGAALIGKSLKACHNDHSNEIIDKVLAWFAESVDNNMIYTYKNIYP